jgi:C1A family cysteine protease
MPLASDQVEGGHAIACVGYDDFKKVFIIRNSWGTNVGDKGYYYMPYSYLTDPNLCDDFWAITTVT